MNRDLPNLTVTSSSKLNAAKAAAWNGDHERAITLCTEALAGAENEIATKIDFLDIRSESQYALARLKLAGLDAQTMFELAQQENETHLLALAGNRLALMQMRDGDMTTAEITAIEALKNARVSKNKKLEAQSCFCLGEVYRRFDQWETAVKYIHLALDQFKELDDPSGQGRAYYLIARYYMRLIENDKLRWAAGMALQHCQRAGDQFGIGNAYNALTASDMDLARNIAGLKQAYQAYQKSGYLERQPVALANLSKRYVKLGLYRRAQRYASKALEISRKVGDPFGLAHDIANLSYVEILLRDAAGARACLVEMAELYSQINLSWLPIAIISLKAELAELEGDFATAAQHYKKGANLARKMDDPFLKIQTCAILGHAYLAMGKTEIAQEELTRAIEMHQSLGLSTVGELPVQVFWLWHSRALSANGLHQAGQEALQKAYGFLVERIKSMSDEGLRRNYLNKVEENRELLTDWLEQSDAQDLEPDVLYAHLLGEADQREPFNRLVDTGLRLNELRSEAELLEFLIEEAAELSGAERVLLFLRNGEGRQLVDSLMPSSEDADLLVDSIREQLDQVRQSRQVLFERAESPDSPNPSRITAPLLAQNKVLGYLYADMDARFGRFDQTDADMLGMLASQAAVALENLRLVEGLEEQVAARTAELQTANADLAKANAEALEARQIAEEANQAKSAFLASMSHELRTPLNAIIGFTRIVRRKLRRTAPEKQLSNLDKVLASAEHLLGLINTVLDLAKIEAGRMDVLPSEYEVEALVEMCLATASPLARPGVEMVASVHPDLPTAYSDQDKIRQILLNTLSNAAKFTHEGTITLRVEQQDGLLLYGVIDSGIGMNEEQLARVFEEFQQAESTTSRDYGGTGLGLPISKQLAQLLGGDLVATSIEGEGSTFTLSIPMRLN